MPSSFTYNQTEALITSRLKARGSAFYTTSEVYEGCKRAYKKICRDLRIFDTSAQQNATVGQINYAWPTRCLEIDCVLYDGKPLTCRSKEWLNRRSSTWRTDPSSTPLYYFLNPVSYFGVWPAPNDATKKIQVDGLFYSAYPTGTSFWDIPEAYESMFLDLAAYFTALKDANGEGASAAQIFLASYQNSLADYLDAANAGIDTVVGGDITGNHRVWTIRANTTGMVP